MKKTFADLHLRLNPRDSAAASRIINKAAALGYRLVAVPFSPETREDETAQLRSMCNETKIDFVSRVDIEPRTQNDLMHQLRRLRRRFEVVCVVCENKEVARQAAKDRRVDLLNFPSLDYHKRFFDRAEAELASNSLAALEIDVKPLLVLEGPARVRLLSSLRRETAIAREFHVPIVVSSGATTEMLLRKPREQAALAALFDLNETSALEAVSQNPVSIVKHNRQKLSSKFVAPGIRVIKEGKDC
ncbi:MAG TPA: RNase P subunit p30 family protein [Candidatus Bathyarchaeia archaeon]|jgi:ribonuclease P/MRP protein subunit RPP1